MLNHLILAVILAGVMTSCDLSADRLKYLLPGNVKPQHYDLTIFTHIDKFNDSDDNSFTFEGTIVITTRVVEDNVSTIILHKHNDIVLDSASCIGEDGRDLLMTIREYDPETNKQMLNLSKTVTKGDLLNISLNYTGRNTEEKNGFYRTSYLNGSNRRWYLVTDFEPMSARRAFPCFDEPRFKATVQLTSYISQSLADIGYKTRSNTDIESEFVRDGWHITKFKTTPRALSTYIVAFLISDLQESPEPSHFQNATKIFKTVGRDKYFNPREDLISQTAGPSIMNFIMEKTGVEYGLDKMTQAGLPNFATVAMENWGLITYRELLLFWDNTTGTALAKQQAIHQIAHELGHQWFGNLVTLHWWTDIWLNEGFATFFQTHAADQIREPSLNTLTWDLIGQFVQYDRQETAFFDDGYIDSRPLTAETYILDEIATHFDGISYEKGASILRMWMHIIGEDVFYAGLGFYLKSQAEGNGTPELLLRSFDKAIESLPIDQRPNLTLPAAELFAPWHLNAGYPVVNATRNGGNVTLSQERFLFSGHSDTRYNIPITLSSDVKLDFNNTKPEYFLLATDDNLTIEIEPASEWFIINNQATGYYRINYDRENWDALVKVLNDSERRRDVHPYNRAQILDDAFNLASSLDKEYLSYNYTFEILRSLRHETELSVWKTAISIMNRLLISFESNTETYTLLKSRLSEIVGPLFKTLTLSVTESDSHPNRILRMNLADIALKLDFPEFRQQAEELYGSKKIPSDTRFAVMCHAIQTKNAEFWNTTFQNALTSDGQVRDDLLGALTCTNDSTLLSQLMQVTLNEDIITEVDAMVIIHAASNRNSKTAETALETVTKKRWNSLLDKIKFERVLARNLASDSAAETAKALSSHASNIITVNKEWLRIKEPEIRQWLTVM